MKNSAHKPIEFPDHDDGKEKKRDENLRLEIIIYLPQRHEHQWIFNLQPGIFRFLQRPDLVQTFPGNASTEMSMELETGVILSAVGVDSMVDGGLMHLFFYIYKVGSMDIPRPLAMPW